MIINAALSAISLQSPQKSSTKTAQQSAANRAQTDSTPDQLAVSAENLDAATPISDLTQAQQVLQSARLGILQQSSTALLAQANLIPDTVLQLLQA